MHDFFETEYIFNNSILLNTSSNNIIRSFIQYIFEADFDNDNEDFNNELEHYISKKTS